MPRTSPSFVLGYHGCEKSVGYRVLNGEIELAGSDKDYDWLGPGVYFWEGDPHRALEWAEWKVTRGEYKEPFVLGAVIDTGNCLDLLVRKNIGLLPVAYEALCYTVEKSGLKLPENRDVQDDGNKDKLLRFLDCAVIRHLHQVVEDQVEQSGSSSPVQPFDTVRGLFPEGEPAYPGSSFRQKSHTQISVINPRMIKGYFLPRPEE